MDPLVYVDCAKLTKLSLAHVHTETELQTIGPRSHNGPEWVRYYDLAFHGLGRLAFGFRVQS